MSLMFAILSKVSDLAISEIVDNAIKEIQSDYWAPPEVFIEQRVGFGSQTSSLYPESKYEKLPYYYKRSECIIVTDARIDYREDIGNKLEVSPEELKRTPDSKLILLAYLQWGTKCVNYLLGDFAFVIWDKNKDLLFCARDHFGCRPFYYVNHDKYFALSSDVKAFRALPEFKYQISEQHILDSICSIITSKNQTAFQGISKLPPAHTLIISLRRPLNIKKYWDLKVIKKFTALSENSARDELKKRFIQAVKERCRSIHPIGLELSGGLDSSAISTTLGKMLSIDFPVYAFSHAIDNHQDPNLVNYISELTFSKKIFKSSKIAKHIIVTGEGAPGALQSLTEYLNNSLSASGQLYSVMSNLLYAEVQQLEAKILLSGFGGDEGVSYNGDGLFEQLVFKRKFRKLRSLFSQRINNSKRGLVYTWLKINILYFFPWLQRITYHDWHIQRFNAFAINRDMRINKKLKRRFLKKVTLPNDPNLRIRQYQRLMHTHIPDRLENSYLASNHYGIEYCYPFLDVRLIEFFYSIPSEYKFKEGLSRYLFRHAMEGIIPDEIRMREDKTVATIPNIMYRIIKDKSFFRELISEGSSNNQFHYVDYEKLNWMLDQFLCLESVGRNDISPNSFLGPISILILQKWQREGKIDIGIKC